MSAIMAGHVIAGQGKKLIVIGLFLVLVLMLVQILHHSTVEAHSSNQ